MLVSVVKAEYLEGYKVYFRVGNGAQGAVDLTDAIFKDYRKIFEPQREIQFFKNLELDSWTLPRPTSLPSVGFSSRDRPFRFVFLTVSFSIDETNF